MKKLSLLLSALILLSFTACSSPGFSEKKVKKEYFTNGDIRTEFIMDDDTSHISKTIVDGSKPSDPDSGSVVYFIFGEDSTSVLCGFSIGNGLNSGIYIQNSAATLTNLRIIGI